MKTEDDVTLKGGGICNSPTIYKLLVTEIYYDNYLFLIYSKYRKNMRMFGIIFYNQFNKNIMFVN